MDDKINSPEKRSNDGFIKQLRDFAGGPLIGVIINLITVPVTTRMIVPEEFGKSSLFVLIQNLFVLVGLLGFDFSFVRYYNNSEYNKKKYCITLSLFHCYFVFFL